MSAFIVSQEHINAILSFGLGAGRRDPQRIRLADESWLYFDNPDHVQRAAEILLAENIRSVQGRYGRERIKHDGRIAFRRDYSATNTVAVQVVKLCDCYNYQACETEDYEASDAYRIVGRIRDAAINALPGYSEAKWSI